MNDCSYKIRLYAGISAYLAVLVGNGVRMYTLSMSDNPTSADNQQERLNIETIPAEIGWYLAGFADGEGSFNISTVNRNQDFKTGWKIVLTFNISQKDHTLLHLFQEILRCGRIHDRGDGVGYYDVHRISDVIDTVIPFFERFSLRSATKKHQFNVFCAIAHLVHEKAHYTYDGLQRILALRETVHVARKRKYTSEQILTSFRIQNPQRLYAEPCITVRG